MTTHKNQVPDDIRAMRETNGLPHSSFVDLDPEDPSQVLNDMDETEEEEAGEEEEEVEEEAPPSETTIDARDAKAEDTGDLYGVYQQKATDRDLGKKPDQEEFIDSEQGENWLETLGKRSVEYGAEVEKVLDVVDDSDEHTDHRGHHKTDTRDRPVADKGSGGDAGV